MEKASKIFFLPEAGNLALDKEQSPPEDKPGIYPCPCCGYHTLPVPLEEALAYICPVCFWEMDLFVLNEDEESDLNHGLTLCQARENYRRYGAVLPRFKQYCRPPMEQERPKEE